MLFNVISANQTTREGKGKGRGHFLAAIVHAIAWRGRTYFWRGPGGRVDPGPFSVPFCTRARHLCIHEAAHPHNKDLVLFLFVFLMADPNQHAMDGVHYAMFSRLNVEVRDLQGDMGEAFAQINQLAPHPMAQVHMQAMCHRLNILEQRATQTGKLYTSSLSNCTPPLQSRSWQSVRHRLWDSRPTFKP